MAEKLMYFQISFFLMFLIFFVLPAAAGEEPDDSVLEPSEMADMVVTGKRLSNYTTLLPQDLMSRPYTESPGLYTATSVIGQKEIQHMKAYSVVDALKYIPGAWTESRGRKVKTFFSVRGQRYPYPGYTIDGAWFREFHETNYFLSTANVDRIEVVRSSSAMLLGPGGMTGMINIIPRKYTSKQTQIDALYGSHDTAVMQLGHGDTNDHLGYAIGLGHRFTSGPFPNSRESISNLYGRLSYQVTPDVNLAANSYVIFGDRELRLAEPPATQTLQTRRDSFDPMRTYILVGKMTYDPGSFASTHITVNYADRELKGHRTGADDWWEKDHEYGINAIQSLRLSENNVLRFGGMFNYWKSPTGKRFYVGRPGELWTYSGVVLDDHEFGKLALNAGYRVSRTYYEQFGGFNIEGSAGPLQSVLVEDEWEDPLHTLTLGLSYKLTKDLAVLGNITWGQIAASPGMVDVNLNIPGTETRSKIDLGFRKTYPNFGDISLTGFYVKQDDAAAVTNRIVVINDEDYALYENTDLENYGVELDIQSHRLKNGLQFFLNAAAMKTRKKENGSWESDEEVPELIFGGGASYYYRHIDVSVFSKYVSSYENERFLPKSSPPAPLGDYTEVTAQAAYYFGKRSKKEIFFRVENITDEEYSTVNGYPDEGRRYEVGLSAIF
ncbi:MAG: TonB-dependent receptor plug domain-containing protein [Desulfobacterales bacterium]